MDYVILYFVGPAEEVSERLQMSLRSRMKEQPVEENPFEQLKSALQTEVDGIRRELRDLDNTITQSQGEFAKLAQRNAQASAAIQQVQSRLDSMRPADVRSAYEAAVDSQQRLFVMRGQLDRLQSDRNQLLRIIEILERSLQSLESATAANASKKGVTSGVDAMVMLVQAQEGERLRLSRQIHDGPAQALSNYILQAEIAARLFDRNPEQARQELENLKISAKDTLQKVRGFIAELRPMMLDDLGLGPTLARYVELVKEQSGCDVRITTSGLDQRLESYLEVLLFRAIQELIGNAVRHGQPTQLKVQVDLLSGEVRVAVEDNGKGFDPEDLANAKGAGLKVLRERVDMLAGEMDIDSSFGKGTRVSLTVPARHVTA